VSGRRPSPEAARPLGPSLRFRIEVTSVLCAHPCHLPLAVNVPFVLGNYGTINYINYTVKMSSSLEYNYLLHFKFVLEPTILTGSKVSVS